MTIRRFLVMAALLSLGFAGDAHAETDPSDVRSGPDAAFQEANETFARAAAQLKSEPDDAKRLLRESAGLYQQVIDSGVKNGLLYYNIGNAEMLLGDVGRAILNYRRAERLIGGDADLASNLSYARARVASRFETPTAGTLRRVALFWHDDLSARTRWWIAAGLWGAFWLLAIVRLIGKVGFRAKYALSALAVGAVAFGASVWMTYRESEESRDAVIVAERVVGRKGPDENGYEPSFKDPLSAGVEMKIVEERPGWLLVKLPDGRETWLPESSVERV
ncbi:MAG TPA: hypothetical protein VG797_08420 [Phycisphaerales bacterium]|nr:hypothetical protein [Phycisphaerales bacterium]